MGNVKEKGKYRPATLVPEVRRKFVWEKERKTFETRVSARQFFMKKEGTRSSVFI